MKAEDWFKFPELEKYAQSIAETMEDSHNIDFRICNNSEIYHKVGKEYGYEIQAELIYRAKALAQNMGKLRTTDGECPRSYKKMMKRLVR